MESARLEQLEQGLHDVLHLIGSDKGDANAPLQADHPAVRAANACELMLPETLTLATLAGSARHKGRASRQISHLISSASMLSAAR